MNPADLRDQLHASLETVTPVPVPLEGIRRAGLRRRRTREGLTGLAVAAVAVGAFALVGGSGPDPDALRPGGPPSATPTATPVAADHAQRAAWQSYVATHPGVPSNLLYNGSGTWGAVAAGTRVTVAEYRDGLFRDAGSVDLPEQQSVVSLFVTTLTGDSDAVPDVVVTGPAGNAVLTSVVRPVDGAYALADFAGCGGTAASCSGLPSAELNGRGLVARLTSCVPNCAEATRRHVLYTWNGTAFAARALPGFCGADSPGWFWQVTGVVRSGSSATITYSVADARCDTDAEPYLEGTGDTRQETVSADLPVTGGAQATAGEMRPGTYEVKHQDRTVTGFELR